MESIVPTGIGEVMIRSEIVIPVYERKGKDVSAK